MCRCFMYDYDAQEVCTVQSEYIRVWPPLLSDKINHMKFIDLLEIDVKDIRKKKEYVQYEYVFVTA